MKTDLFWAKTLAASRRTYPLEQHLLDTAAAAMVLWDLWLRQGLRDLLTSAIAPEDPDLARRIVAAVAGLHDIGKANPRFQSQQRPDHDDPILAAARDALTDAGLSLHTPDAALRAEEATRRHESVTQHLVAGFPAAAYDRIGTDWAGVATGGHHGQFYGLVDITIDGACALARDGLDALLEDSSWTALRDELTGRITRALQVSTEQLHTPLHAQEGEVITLVAGLTILADWIASEQSLMTEQMDESQDRAVTYLARRYDLYTTEIPKMLGIYQPPADARRAVLQQYADSPKPVQIAGEGADRGLWIVAETTGSGKTEAAMLRHMRERENVIWGLPTRATTDAMWDRIRRIYDGTGNVAALLHAHRDLNGFYLGRTDDDLVHSDWAHGILGNVKPLLSPIAVGTVDQILMGALRQKWTAPRLLALANAHLIFDEVHTYDTYQATLVCEVLRWAGLTGARVTMLSASLPQALTEQFAAAYAGLRRTSVESLYPSHTLVPEGEKHAVASPLATARAYDLDVNLVAVAPGDVAAAVVRRVRAVRGAHPSARIAVILNRVDTVIDVGRSIPDALVMHSRMTSAHRSAVGAAVDERFGRTEAGGGVLVGTQVIEASLDYDVDFMISELAPAASLIQRAGRLWRHSDPTGDVWVHPRGRFGDETTRFGQQRPGLTVLVQGSLTKVHPAAEYPYALGALQRTLNALHPLPVLSVPEDVQPLVDAAHFDERTMSEVDALSPEFALAIRHLAQAQSNVIRAQLPSGPFGSSRTHQQIALLTSKREYQESGTRFTDREQTSIVLVGGGLGRYGFTEDELAQHINGRSVATHRAVLERTIPVNLPAPDDERKSAGYTKRGLTPTEARFAHPRIVDTVPAHLTSAVYDPRLGLIFQTTS